MNSREVHEFVRDWAQTHLGLIEQEGDDRLWDDRGHSFKVKGRTGTKDRFATSFDFGHDHRDFDFLVGVVLRRITDPFLVG